MLILIRTNTMFSAVKKVTTQQEKKRQNADQAVEYVDTARYNTVATSFLSL